MAETADWLESFAADVASAVEAHAAPSPLGWRGWGEYGGWEVLVYPLPVELVGGADDGAEVCPGFSVDLEAVRSLLDRVDGVSWDAHGMGPDGPCVSVEGAYRGRPVWLRILAYAPEDEGPAARVDATGRRVR